MHYGGEGEELYLMVKDPHQYTYLVHDPNNAEILNEARAALKARMKAAR